MKTLARITICVVLLTLPAVALAAGGATRVYVPNCSTAAYKPKRITLACGDGSIYLAKLAWSRWTTRTATGRGVEKINNCTPDCVRGRFQAYPATVTLSRPKRCPRLKRHKVFGHIVIQYQAAHPGRSSRAVASLACPF